MEKGWVAPLSSSSLIDQQQDNKSKLQGSSLYPSGITAVLEWARMLAVEVVLFGLYVWFGGPELLFLSTAVGVLLIGGLLLYLCGPRRIELSHQVTPVHCIAGEAVTVTVKVSFRSRIPLPWMTITDRWSGGAHQELLFPGLRRSFTYSYRMTELARGYQQLEDCCVRWGDLPGWFTGRHYLREKARFKVLPAPLYFGRVALEGGYSAGDSAASPRGLHWGQDTDIRDYRPGDPLSRIHWKSSAHRGSLQSRTPERETSRMLCVVLDNAEQSYEIPPGALSPRGLKRNETPVFEKAVSAAMGLMLSAERSGAYVQLFSGGWPEGMARHEGVGKLPGRVLNTLTGILPDSTRSLSQLLDDASRGWIPGMSVAVITGRLEHESAKVLARLLAHGVKVHLYYAWDRSVADSDREVLQEGMGEAPAPVTGTIGDSLIRLGAGLHCFDHARRAYDQGEGKSHESQGKPTVR